MASQESLENLQTALSMELTAQHQYQLHAAVLDDWGLDLLAAQMRSEMAEETGHSNEFLNRILFLKGAPEMKLAKAPVRAASLAEMFQADLQDEQEAIQFYTQASLQAAADGDLGTRALFEKIALGEEEHMAWLELQLDLLKRMGEPAYTSKHMSPAGEGA
ncbi:MAG: bacterioferritin [Planctomycetales bacterium]|nr:bacterioferritin [Planctomycetales bacterium]